MSRKPTWLFLACLMLAGTFSCSTKAENSLSDENNAKTLIVEDRAIPYDIMRVQGDSTTGAIFVLTATSTAFLATPEWDNVAITGSSVALLDPGATSYGFCFQNATASSVFLKWSMTGETAGDWDGFRIEAGGNRCLYGIKYSSFSVYVPVTATMSVEHVRY